ncbi:YdcF family protein [Paenibacillus sp. NPDC058071]|uniref:YdcF family protein n=1 Tax=Paenibacillus sp. NPDC058071 TaxID=3346326 RepID=UPI0036D9EEAE
MTKTNKNRNRRGPRTVIFTAAGLAFLCCLLFCVSAYRIWTFGNVSDSVKADAAIVLGAAVWNGEPSPVLKKRIEHAVTLYRQGSAGKIIFTGGRTSEGEPSEAEASFAYAELLGVPPKDMLIETESTITEQNLLYSRKIAARNGLNSYLIVSDPLHMKRAMTMAHRFGMEAYSSPAADSAYQSLRTKLPFLFRETFYEIGFTVTSPFRSFPGS